jgi:hypothetical protein
MAPEIASIVALPTPTPVASPLVVMVATPIFIEAQVTEPVTSCDDPSLNVPVAVNCVVSPLAMFKFEAVTVMDCNVGALVPEEEQLLKTKIAQTQIISTPTLGVGPKNTPHL